MKTFITVLSLLLFSFLCGVQTQSALLEKANNQHSKQLLKQFFENWHKEIPSITNAELDQKTEMVKQAYLVFKAFYTPTDIKRLGGSEFGNDLYKNVQYLLISPRLLIYPADKIFYSEKDVDDYVVDQVNKNFSNDSMRRKWLQRTNGKLSEHTIRQFGPDNPFARDKTSEPIDSILDFRPQITGSKKPLYLTKNYMGILNSFLGSSEYELGSGGIMNPARSKEESAKRKAFLENYIRIWYGHWGGYWQLVSYPGCTSLAFDKNFEYAKIQFTMVYEGGEAVLKKENGEWKLISSKRTWIQ